MLRLKQLFIWAYKQNTCVLRMEDNMEKLVVNYDEKPCYSIMLTTGFQNLKEMLLPLEIMSRKVCVITDSNVGELYLEEVKSILSDCCKEVISYTFPAGEESKNLDVISKMYETMIEAKMDRNDLMVALGGGVVGDMTGFAAATYLRGIRFVQIPTTLLSMVDSSIGGKTGVDYKAYKNMVGAFHQPSAVYMNLCTLKTLTKEQYRSGMGEIIKHALIKDKNYYTWLNSNQEAILLRDMEVVKTMVSRSLKIKREVVEHDPKERGERALLNFGHTLGHAIEKHMNFAMYHGDCVAIGIVAASYLSLQRNLIALEEFESIKQMLINFTLPITIEGLNPMDVVLTTKSDKKMEAGKIKFILLKNVGTAYIDMTVTEEDMLKALQAVIV